MSGLVLPDDPRDEARVVTKAYGRYLLGCGNLFLGLEPHLTPRLRPAYARIAALVQRQLADSATRADMLSCFAVPAVGTPLHCVALHDELPAFADRIEAASAAMLSNLLFEMALRGLIPEGESLLCEGAAPLASTAIGGELHAPQDTVAWRFAPSHVTAVGHSGELDRLPLELGAMSDALGDETCGITYERRFWRLAGGPHFATADANPIAAFEAHPDKAGNHVDLGEHSEDDWVATLDQAFELIAQYLPGEAEEMVTLLQHVIPVGYDDVKHLSASYREAVGTVYLTLHPNLMTMTEALIHEFQHNKFNLSAYQTEYLSNAFHPLYKSPIRPDPRPLWGITLAVHAFLPVAELYRRMRDAGHDGSDKPDFQRRLNEIDLKNHEGMEMLRAHAEWTPAGRVLFDDLEALESAHLADRAARGLDSTPTDVHLA